MARSLGPVNYTGKEWTVKKNRMSTTVSKLAILPAALRSKALTLMMGRMVPFVATSRLVVEELTEERVVARIPNVRRVQNHIGGVHAAGMALLAETVTGFVVGMNVPDTALPLIRTLGVRYEKRARGGLRAVATLGEEQRRQIREEPKGSVTVPVTVTDESGEEPIRCEMVWAWVPCKRD